MANEVHSNSRQCVLMICPRVGIRYNTCFNTEKTRVFLLHCAVSECHWRNQWPVPAFHRQTGNSISVVVQLANWLTEDPAGNCYIVKIIVVGQSWNDGENMLCLGLRHQIYSKRCSFFFIDFLQKKVNLSSGTCGWGG